MKNKYTPEFEDRMNEEQEYLLSVTARYINDWQNGKQAEYLVRKRLNECIAIIPLNEPLRELVHEYRSEKDKRRAK